MFFLSDGILGRHPLSSKGLRAITLQEGFAQLPKCLLLLAFSGFELVVSCTLQCIECYNLGASRKRTLKTKYGKAFRYLLSQSTKIPIRDWNAKLPIVQAGLLASQSTKIPIRDWNLCDFLPMRVAIPLNPLKSLSGIETCKLGERFGCVSSQSTKIPIRDWNKALNTQNMEVITALNPLKSLSGIETCNRLLIVHSYLLSIH